MGNIYRFLKCQFYFSYYNATYSCIIEKNSKISENIEKIMNVFPIVNSVKSVTVYSFLEGVLIISIIAL